jgi:sugar lactone lactonase YvrE
VNRTSIIAALAGAVVLAAGAALYFSVKDRLPATPGRPVWLSAEAPTRPAWSAHAAALAGDGVEGVVDGPGLASRFSDPFGAVADAHGNVFVAEGGAANRIRRIAKDGTVTTFAGGQAGFADGPGAGAAFDTPSGLAIDRLGNLYVADTGNNAIRMVAPDGSVSTLAGGGEPGYLDGVGRAARFDGPVGVAVDREGIVYVADTYNDRIRRIARDGTVTTLAGSGVPVNMDGIGTAAGFDTPSALAVGKDGVLYVADTGNDAIRRIDKTGAVTTLAPPPEDTEHGPPRRPVALTLTHDGWLYIGGADGRIVQRGPDGAYRALGDADRPPAAGSIGDGSLRLYGPRGIAVRRDGSLVVADGEALQVLTLAPPPCRPHRRPGRSCRPARRCPGRWGRSSSRTKWLA